jgi:hypothetical protein
MRDGALVFPILDPGFEIAAGFVADPDQRGGVRISEPIEDVGQLRILGGAVGIHDLEEGLGLWRRGLGIEIVNARIPPAENSENGKEKTISAAAWLDKNRSVEQMTWAPGLPMIIPDRLVSDGGWIEHKDVSCFNLYKPPTIAHGDPNQADLWLNLVEQIFPNDCGHIVSWLAHRVQHPEEKNNHALVLDGAMGIGKDTIVEPVKHAIGPWNFHEVSPQQMARSLQRIREVDHPAHQRGARSRRHQPLRVL